MASKRKRPPAAQQANPTPERLLRARGDYQFGDDEFGRKILTMRDSPLERARLRGAITQSQYDAGQKYYHHWCRMGRYPPSLDLDRVFGGFGAPHSEKVAHSAKQLAAARDWLGEHVSIIDRVIIDEMPLSAIGAAYGWKNEAQAIAVATDRLRLALDRLCELWGL